MYIGHAVKKIPTGGRLLEIAPWTWRRHPMIHFNLSSDPHQISMLFELGYLDASDHQKDLDKFFKGRKL